MNDEYGFRGLVVWQKPQELALAVLQAVAPLPNHGQANMMAVQVVRSAGSVSANIAEGYGRFNEGAYRNHLSIARGSLFETESWIDLLLRSGFLREETAQELCNQCHSVGRLLTTRMKQLQTRGSKISEELAIYEAYEPTENVVK